MATRFLAYIRGLMRRRAVAAEVDDELRFHVEQEVEANIARGMSPSEARRAALRDLGGLTQTREAVGDVRTIWLDLAWRDIRHAVRALAGAPGFSAVALLILILSIGASTAIYSVIDAVILRGLPFDHDDQLMSVGELNIKDSAPDARNRVAPQNFLDWRAQQDVFTGLAAINDASISLNRQGPADPEILRVADGDRGFLLRAARRADDRPGLHDRQRGGRPRPRGGHQLQLVAATIWRVAGRARAAAARPARGFRNPRRDAAGVRLPGGRDAPDGGVGALRRSGAGARARQSVRLQPPGDRAVARGRHDCGGAGADGSDYGRPGRRDAAMVHRSRRQGRAAARVDHARRTNLDVAAAGRRHLRHAHRLRESRESDAGSCDHADARARDSRGARRLPLGSFTRRSSRKA